MLKSKEEDLRVYKIRLENTIRQLEKQNLNDKEIEAYNERLEVYTKEIKRLEKDLGYEN